MSGSEPPWLDPDEFWDDDDEPRPRRVPGDQPAGDEIPTVMWVPIRCPGCGSTDKATRKTSGHYRDKGRRYHKCKRCQLEFHSEEWTQP